MLVLPVIEAVASGARTLRPMRQRNARGFKRIDEVADQRGERLTMARTGIYALIDELKTAASTDDASRRIDRFVIDLEEDAKDYGWPEEKIAVQQAKLRRLIKATMREDRRGAVRSNFQAALDRLKASRGSHKLRVLGLALFGRGAATLRRGSDTSRPRASG